MRVRSCAQDGRECLVTDCVERHTGNRTRAHQSQIFFETSHAAARRANECQPGSDGLRVTDTPREEKNQ
jgi:hypothetical protein